MEFYQGRQGIRMASVEREVPESGDVSLVYLLMSLCIPLLFTKASTRQQLRFSG